MTIIKVPLVPLHTHTHTHTDIFTLTHCLCSFTLSHSHRLCTSGFMVCEQHSPFFFFFFMRGLDKQYLEPIDRYAVHYPICWNTFLSLPVTLARTWQNWTVDQTHRVNKTKEFKNKNMWKCYLKKDILRTDFCHFFILFCMVYSYLCDTLRCIDRVSTKC